MKKTFVQNDTAVIDLQQVNETSWSLALAGFICDEG